MLNSIAGLLHDLRAELIDPLAEHLALLSEDRRIDRDPVELHLRQHIDQRRLQIIGELAKSQGWRRAARSSVCASRRRCPRLPRRSSAIR